MKKLLFFCVSFLFCGCGGGPEVVYDVPFEDMVSRAKETGNDFCVVLSRTDCPPCASYIEDITNRHNKNLFGNTTFNMVDVMQSENSFYTQLLCSGAFPTTCVFRMAS